MSEPATAQQQQPDPQLQLAFAQRYLSACVRRMGGAVELTADEFRQLEGGELQMAPQDGGAKLLITFKDAEQTRVRRVYAFGEDPAAPAPPPTPPIEPLLLAFLQGEDPGRAELTELLAKVESGALSKPATIEALVGIIDRLLALLPALREQFALVERMRVRRHSELVALARELASLAGEQLKEHASPPKPSEVAARNYDHGRYLMAAFCAEKIVEALQTADAEAVKG